MSFPSRQALGPAGRAVASPPAQGFARPVSRRARQSCWRGDDGAAVVESTLVMTLLVVLLLALLQVGFVLHIRNTLVACAADGARYAANADHVPADGAERTRTMIDAALGARYATDVTASTETVAGVNTVVVEVHAVMPVLGPLGFEGAIVVRGHAYEESG